VPFIFCILISNLKLTKHFEYSYWLNERLVTK
jgi:hypothetical protein